MLLTVENYFGYSSVTKKSFFKNFNVWETFFIICYIFVFKYFLLEKCLFSNRISWLILKSIINIGIKSFVYLIKAVILILNLNYLCNCWNIGNIYLHFISWIVVVLPWKIIYIFINSWLENFCTQDTIISCLFGLLRWR